MPQSDLGWVPLGTIEYQWVPLSLCSGAREPQLRSPCSATTEAHVPASCAPPPENPLQ